MKTYSSYSLPTLNLPNYVRFRFDQLKEITGSGKTDSSTCSSAQCYIFCSSLWFIKTLRVDEREADVCSLKTSRCSILRISGYWGSHSFHTVTCCCHLEPPPRTIACSKLWFSIQKIIHTLLFLWLKLSGRSADSFLILSLLKRVFFFWLQYFNICSWIPCLSTKMWLNYRVHVILFIFRMLHLEYDYNFMKKNTGNTLDILNIIAYTMPPKSSWYIWELWCLHQSLKQNFQKC